MPGLFGFTKRPPDGKWGVVNDWQDRLLTVSEGGAMGWRLMLLTAAGDPTGVSAVVVAADARDFLRVAAEPESEAERQLAATIRAPAPVVQPAAAAATSSSQAYSPPPSVSLSSTSSGSGGGHATVLPVVAAGSRVQVLARTWRSPMATAATAPRLAGFSFPRGSVLLTEGPHCAMYTHEAGGLVVEFELVLEARIPTVITGTKLTVGIVARRYHFPTDAAPKQFKPGATGHIADVPARQPRPGDGSTLQFVQENISCKVDVSAVSPDGRGLTCLLTIPADTLVNIGVRDFAFRTVTLPVAARDLPVSGPSSSSATAGVAALCAYKAVGGKKAVTGKRKAASGPDAVDDRSPDKKLRESTDDAPSTTLALMEGVRLTMMRTAAVALPDHGVFDDDIVHKQPFLTFKHVFHACLWANNATPEEVGSPGGLVYQVVQNLRLYHDRWAEGVSHKADALPYPPEEPQADQPVYDEQNEGWNVLDHPTLLKQGGQCNQVGSLMVDVLATLGVQGRVLELESVYETDGGLTRVRQMMKGYSLHGVLAVDFLTGGRAQTWCYDTTMSRPPARWFGTLAKAKTYPDYSSFPGDDWRYIRFRGIDLTEEQAADATMSVLAVHLPPASSLGSAQAIASLPGWSRREGNCAVVGPKARAFIEPLSKGDAAERRTPTTFYGVLAAKKVEAKLPPSKIRSASLRTVPLAAADYGAITSSARQFMVPRGTALATITLTSHLSGRPADTTWTINDGAPSTGATRALRIDTAGRFVVKAANTDGDATIVVWVVWAELASYVAGDIADGCSLTFGKLGAGQPREKPRTLGVIHTDDKAGRGAFGRQYARARLLPDGIGHVIPRGWKLERWISHERTWIDEDAVVDRRNVDDNATGKGADKTAAQFLPDATGHIALLDAPNVGRFPRRDMAFADYFVETWMNFRHHVSFLRDACSERVFWSFGGYWVAYGKGKLVRGGEVVNATEDDVDVWVEAELRNAEIAMPEAARFKVIPSSNRKPPQLKRL